MKIDELRKIRNKNVAQQNELAYLEMKECTESIASFPWITEVLEANGESIDNGILIRLSDTPEQGGMTWYGSWLTYSEKFYEFEVLTDWKSRQVIEIESWKELIPEINAHKKGTGKTHGFIALELLSEYTQKLTRQ